MDFIGKHLAHLFLKITSISSVSEIKINDVCVQCDH